ncbi:nitrilase-related carbon-nitrogen hydrolase [Quadrisphaera sp. DSM 44207]|uniref:nitrilase-related carbon-nitrogen hydrolase n=1 Tax=Quadrisphaera sp. DSM 44207 TaxID=1881057 RepID=UPI00087F76E0|nr:nitrilase-related carbon-nitrogen hydrolase [Quadrisphaera sp. DSM 44207]SDQ88771.1 Predicted amidohydrolase [Quadrisphaera sp. DSM 44207]
MRVHVLQVGYGDDEPVPARRERVAALVAAQRGADLVVLPELWAPGGFAYRHWPERAEPVDGPTLRALADAARAAGAVVHGGSIVERAAPGEPSGPDGRGLWNTSLVLGPDGALLATYRKVHRFGFGAGEPLLLEAGEDVVTARLPAPSGDVTTGLATCYDLRFPELFRALVDRGAQLVLVPAAWPAARVEQWSLLARARAVEDQVVLVAANTAGTHAGHRMGGRSAVVDARGRVLAEAGDDEQVLAVDVDLADAARWREEFPVLADRRLPAPPVARPVAQVTAR